MIAGRVPVINRQTFRVYERGWQGSKEVVVWVVSQLEFLRVLCGFSSAHSAVKGCCSCGYTCG